MDQLGHWLERDDLTSQRGRLLPLGDRLDLRADGFRDPLNLLRLDDDPRQLCEVPPAFVEGLLAPDPAHHAPHSRAEGGPGDVQRLVLRDHPPGTGGTVVVGPLHVDGGEHREDRLAAVIDEPGRVPLPAVDARPAGAAPVGVEQVLQHHAAHLVHGGPDGHLGGLEVEVPEPLAILQGAGDEAVYFAPDLRVDRLDDFFFRRAASAPSVGTRTGRSAQIRSLSSRSCWTRARKC